MSTTEFNSTRQELIDWINSLKDTGLLSLLNSIKLSQTDDSSDWWSNLSENQKKNIELGIKDMEAGTTMSSTKFWSQFKNG